jgi:hypothetical protein
MESKKRLAMFLSKNDWRLANEETRRLLMDSKPWQPDVVKAIDSLWLVSSGHKFGFSLQFAIWKQLGGSTQARDIELWRSFRILGDRVGWRRNGYWACWDDVEYWPQVPIVPVVPSNLNANEAPAALLPFHDVVTFGDWKHGFSPRDCWGEAVWNEWLEVFRLLDE